ncbi:MAG TPA: hypothetical protein VHO67_18060 [Polyangia bacterium]|nr:hypothetical protein [Polyangia bacterium]
MSTPAVGRAAPLSSSAECTTDNLLALRMPSGRQDLHGDVRLVTDNAVGPEGAQWDAPIGVILDTPAGSITYDLGSVRPVGTFLLQADANDTYKIFGADVDRPDAYKLLVEVDNVVNIGHGLRTRTVTIDATPVRYLRVGEATGDGFYSITEFQAYCRAPTPFPPKMTISSAPPAIVVEPSFWKFAWWENDASSRLEMCLAIFGVALIGWGLWLRKKGRPDFKKKLRDRLLMVLGVLSFCAYWNFFSFHFGNYVHMWDTFHYYIGSKYFNELSYDRLYECVAVADSEEPGLRRRVELRKIMNLRTNMMVGTQDVLANPEHCKSHFTPERWNQFKHDVGYFRSHHDIKRWEEAQTDHGYNGSPVWNIMGTTLANAAPASDAQINVLTRIDPFFILGICAMTWWAFGWRVMCVALAVFATNFPSRFYWTGGAFLRWDWLFYLVGGICLVKKERPLLGGFFLGYTTLLRIFPVFVFSGPLLLILRQVWGSREGRPWWQPEPWDSWKGALARIDRRLVRILAGAALSVAILVPISLVTSNGIEGYRAFRFNTQKHKETPLTNYMGLRTVVAYSPSEAGRVMKDDRQEDPWGPWKKQKLVTFHNRFPFYLLLALGFVALLYTALRDAEPWVACAMGTMMIAVGVELTCYYYSFLFATAFLYEKRKDAGAIMLGITAATGFFDWAPTRYLPDTKPWANLKMPQWLDEQYMWMSVATLLGFVWILYRFAYPPENAVQVAATAAAAEGPAPSVPAVPHVPRRNPRRGGGGGGRRRGARRGRR